MRHRISQYSLVLVSFFVLLFNLSLIESAGAGTAPPKISPTEGDAGHPFTLIDPQEARLADGAVAVFQAYGIEVMAPLRTHKPYKTAQGRLPQDMYAGEYTVVVRNLDGSEFVIGTFTVLGLAPEPPSIQPDIGAWGTAFTITDPLGRIHAGDYALFYAEGSAPSIDRAADNIYISADGMTLTGTVPYAAEDGVQNFVAVRPSVTDSSRFGDLPFFVTLGPPEPNLPPSFTSTPVVISDTSSYYTYDADATDPNPGDTLTFSLITSPGGSINPSTGLISWVTLVPVGDYTFEVQVEDQDGLSAIQTFTLTVSNLSGEGCDAAFWKVNTDLWMPYYDPDMLFVQAFGRDVFPNLTLHQVISFIDGYDPDMVDVLIPPGATPPDVVKDALIQLGINTVAALENAATSVHYDLDIEAVIVSFQQAYDGGTVISFQDANNAFEKLNNQVCPF